MWACNDDVDIGMLSRHLIEALDDVFSPREINLCSNNDLAAGLGDSSSKRVPATPVEVIS